MKATGVNLKLLCQIERSDSKCVDAILASTDFEDLIEQAKNGDRDAAREILGLASGYLTSDVFGEMPPELRRYLGMAFASIILGEKADMALNLSKSGTEKTRTGRFRKSHRTKLRLAHWIHKEMVETGKSLVDVSSGLSVCIEDDYLAKGSGNETFFGYKKAPNEKTLQKIYRDMRPELEIIYGEVRTTRAALKRSGVFESV